MYFVAIRNNETGEIRRVESECSVYDVNCLVDVPAGWNPGAVTIMWEESDEGDINEIEGGGE